MSFASLLSSIEEQQKRKLAAKLPEYAGLGMSIPSSLALEQCSSSAAARYKAALAASFVSLFAGGMDLGFDSGLESSAVSAFDSGLLPARVVDITGGLGVDSFAFSRLFSKVDYYERNPALVDAVRGNAALLGISNLEFHCEEVGPETVLPEADLIFADPARRDAVGRKVFRLEDCSPNVLELLPLLFERAPRVMLKLSPMADISALRAAFGSHLFEIHIVSLGQEIKELLCLLGRDGSCGRGVCSKTGDDAGVGVGVGVGVASASGIDDGFRLVLKLLGSSEGFAFCPEEEKAAPLQLASSLAKGDFLLDPCAALRKAGAFKLICSRFGVEKLDVSTHLYRSEAPLATDLFRQYEVVEVLPFGKDSFKRICCDYPRADVSAHNIPLSSAQLSEKLGIRAGGGVHIFGLSLAGARLLAVTRAAKRLDI